MNIDIEETFYLAITLFTALFSIGIQWPLWTAPLLIHLSSIALAAGVIFIAMYAHDRHSRNLDVFRAIDSFPLRFTGGRGNDPKSGSGLFSLVLFMIACAFIVAAFLARCLWELSFYIYGLM